MDNEREAREGIRLTKEFTDLITKAIPVRKDTIQVLQEIATELENVNQGVNISKVVGYGVSILGGIAAAAGIVLTGGALAVPLVAGGAVAGAAGTTTAVGSDIYGKLASKGKLEKAQDALNKDKEIVSSIEEIYDKLDKIATSLSENLKKDKSEILGSLFSNAFANVDDTSNILLPIARIGLKQLSVSTKLIQIGKDVTKMATKATLKGVGRTAFNVVFSSLFVVWDVINLVQTSMELSGGSKTEAATELRKIADQLNQENENLEKILQEIRSLSEQQLDTIMAEKMDKLLKKIADNKKAESSDVTEFECVAKYCTLDGWLIAYKDLSEIDKEAILLRLALLFRDLLITIFEYFEQKGRKIEQVVMTLIAHGSLDTDNSKPIIPCSLFYSTRSLKDIRFYQPWGYGIGADVVIGILTNVMKIRDVTYIPETLNPPERPESWNSLPNTPFESICCPVFSPIHVNENAVQNLQVLRTSLPAITPGLVFFYTSGSLPLIRLIQQDEKIYLFLLTSALGFVGHCYGIEIEFRYAACLTPSHNNNWSNRISQYHRFSGTLIPGQGTPNMVWTPVLNEFGQYIHDNLSMFNFG